MDFIGSLTHEHMRNAEENADLLEICERQQPSVGDCLPLKTQVRLPTRINFELRENDLSDLKTIWNRWTPQMRGDFVRKFGHIAYLAIVPVDKNLLRAVIQFWDPSYRCFTFNDIDLTPLIEEYHQLLNLPAAPTKAYWYRPRAGARKKLGVILGMQVHDLERLVGWSRKGAEEGIPWDFLRNFITSHPNDEWGLNAMALAVYGLVIFPRAVGYVDAKVIIFFEQVLKGVSPGPAILAETIRSLNYCRRKGKGRFIGCAQLLQVWLLGHLECEVPKFKPVYHRGRIPICETINSDWKMSFTKDEWILHFKNITEAEINWRAPWMIDCSVIYGCGNLFWVPLLGPWGVASYAPTLVRRQVCAKQFVPLTKGLDRLEFSYEENITEGKVNELVQAWDVVRRVKPGIRGSLVSTERYADWLKVRGRGFTWLDGELEEGRGETEEVNSENSFVALVRENESLLQQKYNLTVSLEKAEQDVRDLRKYIDNIERTDVVGQMQRNVLQLEMEKLELTDELHKVAAQLQESEARNESLMVANEEKEKRIQWLENEYMSLKPYYENHARFTEQVNMLMGVAENVTQRAKRFANMAEEAQKDVVMKYPEEQGLLNFLGDVHREFHYLANLLNRH